jgi:hypothetical protein
MSVVGRWDPDLYVAFRRARRAALRCRHDDTQAERACHLCSARRELLGELLRVNEPLVRTITSQRQATTAGAEHLGWDDALTCGRLAFGKTMDQWDARRGRLASYLGRKIVHELQTAAETAWPGVCVHRKRGEKRERGPAVVSFEVVTPALEARRVRDRLDEVLVFEDEDAEEREDDRRNRLHTMPPARDLRRALDVFLEERCRFAPSARAPASVLRFQFEQLARARGDLIERGALTHALEARGAHLVRMRVPWERSPVDGFRGVSLQSEGRAA